MGTAILQAADLSKKYAIYSRPVHRLYEAMGRGRRTFHQDFWALRSLDFEVGRGSTVGVIGPNGSGKSTLLQLIAGILRPTTGSIHVRGRLAALLELGAGFNPEFTGRENVLMNGALMGFTRKQTEARMGQILEFAEIGDFIDRPVKTYSSGMFVRLAFSVAIHVDPDVLLVDEALSVGDAVFQHRCMDRIEQLRRSGVTIFFVSHDITAVRRLCDHVMLLDRGQLLEAGDPDVVVSHYVSIISDRERRFAARSDTSAWQAPVPAGELEPVLDLRGGDRRHGTGRARFVGCALLDAEGKPTSLVESGAPFRIRMSLDAQEHVEQPLIGINLSDRLGNEITATNTEVEKFRLPALEPGTRLTVEFTLHPPALLPGSYSCSIAVNDGDQEAHELCDWIVNALVFEISSHERIMGICRIPAEIAFSVQSANLPSSTVRPAR